MGVHLLRFVANEPYCSGELAASTLRLFTASLFAFMPKPTAVSATNGNQSSNNLCQVQRKYEWKWRVLDTREECSLLKPCSKSNDSSCNANVFSSACIIVVVRLGSHWAAHERLTCPKARPSITSSRRWGPL